MAQKISRSVMGVLDKLGQGGQGVVYRAPSVRTTFAKSMVFKEYKPATLASLNVAALEAMPEFLESLPYRDGAKLISLASWPCAVVEDGGAITGFVMPSIPDEFFTELWTAKGQSQVEAEFQHLLNEPQVLAARFRSGVISDRQRYELLQQAASALAFLHERGVCVGDISPKNLLFALSPLPAVYFVDCDAMRVNGVSLAHQVETPGWEVPAGQEKATVYSDRYKLGLLALRLLVGSQDGRDPARLPSATPAGLRQVIAETLSRAPEQRPSLDQWDAALAQAIAVTPHRPPPPPPPVRKPTPTVMITPPSAPSTTPRPTVAMTPPSQPGLPPLPPQAPVSAAPQASSSNRNTWLLIAGGLLLVVLLPMIITNLNKSTTTSSPTTRTATDYPSSSTNTPTRVTTVTETSTITRTPAAAANTAPVADCGVDLKAPAVLRAAQQIEPVSMYPLDSSGAWGNYNPCSELSVALIPTAMGTGSSPVQALMFHYGTYVGSPTGAGQGYLRFNEQLTTDTTVVLTYRATYGSCGGCADATWADVRYQLKSGQVIALDPIPKMS